jgi:site-specific DNA-adenine methylase
MYKEDDKAFLFLDPPYLFQCNTSYIPQQKDNDMSDLLCIIREYIKDCKCKVMLIINDLKINRYIYEGYIKMTYNIIYQISKKQTTHLVITNY